MSPMITADFAVDMRKVNSCYHTRLALFFHAVPSNDLSHSSKK